MYENRGNQTKVSEPVIGTLTYNAANQMTSASGPGDQASYTYAGTDQVELTQAGSIKLDYGHDDQHGMAWLQSWTNGAALTAYVERDGLGSPLGLRIGTADYAYVLDGQGSVMAIVGSNNIVAATYQYDPYGAATSTDETGLGQPNIVRYVGGIYDKNTTLTKYGQRWYNSYQGRFTQQDNLSFAGDPSKGNRYAYAGANPVNYIDPTGQTSGIDYMFTNLAMIGGTMIGVALAPVSAPLIAGVAVVGAVSLGLDAMSVRQCVKFDSCLDD